MLININFSTLDLEVITELIDKKEFQKNSVKLIQLKNTL